MIVAITGGIGCGKSVVSQVLRLLGYPVYDSDSRAKQLMRHSPTIRKQLEERFGKAIFSEGKLQTRVLSALVFSETSALADLNAIVHPAVRADMLQWAKKHDKIAFVETAIPYASGVHAIVDHLWKVTAPTAIRVERVMKRNAISREEVLRRIAAQAAEEQSRNGDVELVNDGSTALIPQIVSRLQLLK
ncbi:MAG: dephospho-CoA kinase [Sodaliphilus sp.]